MVIDFVQLGLAVLGIYLLAGILFAVPFVAVGVGQVDPGAARSTWGFRLIIVPGVVALWPWLALRWKERAPRPERNAHRAKAAEGRSPE